MRTRILAVTALCLVIAGCASTQVDTTGQRLAAPLCSAAAPIAVFVAWQPQWRHDQKEPALREAAAARGIQAFVDGAGCVVRAQLLRLPGDTSAQPPSDDSLLRLAASTMPAADRVLHVVVHELGPKLLIGGTGIVEGGTEVVADVRVLDPRQGRQLASVTTRWQNGGAFVVKGVQTLDQDMAAALRAVLMP